MDETRVLPQMRVQGPLAEAFVAYASLATDMGVVEALLAQLAARPVQPKDVPIEADPIGRALWTAALIAYARCWGAGARKGYVNQVPVPADLRADHRWMLAMRGKHVAHMTRDNEAEHGLVTLVLDPAQPAQPVNAVTLLSVTMAMPDEERHQQLAALAAHFRADYTARAQAAADRILARAQAIPSPTLLAAAQEGRDLVLDGG